MLTIEELATFCKKKGFVYPNSEIYGGLAGFFDFGHLGVELNNNIKQAWWDYHVKQRDDVVGIDGTIINNPALWKASGHVDNFEDVLVEDSKTKERFRADQLVEDVLKISCDGMSADELWNLIQEKGIKSPKGNDLLKPKQFNLMFKTNVGPVESDKSISYLRAETAQIIFANFKLVQQNARLKLPFGIAQIGKVFRNEISPRDFLFRCREFEQMEVEYFIDPDDTNNCPYLDEVNDHEILVYSEEMQNSKKDAVKMTIKNALDKKIIKTQWHAYWLAMEHRWYTGLGAKHDNFRIRQHLAKEKSHYALDTWDLEYKFPFGWKELQGMANRTDFDLKQHMEHSKKDLSYFDEAKKKKIIPHVVAEPSQGVGRAFLVFMFDAYDDDKKRGNVVLKLHPKLAPVKVAVFPLVSNKEEVMNKAKEVYGLLKKDFDSTFDTSGSVGRRYARADESGICACVTVDFDSLNDDSVTLRDRDSTKQVRVSVSELNNVISKFLKGEDLEKLGKVVS